jgi:hypothetical protein
MQTPISALVFHKNAHRHVDDAACLWLARTRPEAEARFPGISEAEVIFDGTGGETFEGKSGDELEREGILMFGVGSGRLDEHPGPKTNGKQKCSFVLFCEEIGVVNDPAMAKIIEYVAESDRGNSGHPMAIGSIAKVMEYTWPDDPIKVFQWQADALNAMYRKQAEFVEAQKEYDKNATEEKVRGPSGQILVATIESGNALMKDVAFFNGVGILVQWRPINCEMLPGNATVFTHRKARIDLSMVVAELRQEEQRANGRPVTTDPQKIRAPGKMEGVPEWYYLIGDAGQTLLNGSFSAPNTPATKLPLQTIKNIVIANLQ